MLCVITPIVEEPLLLSHPPLILESPSTTRPTVASSFTTNIGYHPLTYSIMKALLSIIKTKPSHQCHNPQHSYIYSPISQVTSVSSSSSSSSSTSINHSVVQKSSVDWKAYYRYIHFGTIRVSSQINLTMWLSSDGNLWRWPTHLSCYDLISCTNSNISLLKQY